MANKNNARRSKKILSLMIVICLMVSSCSIKQKTSPPYLLYPGEKLPEYEIDYARVIAIVPKYIDADSRFFDYIYNRNKGIFKHKCYKNENK